ncbi:SCP2 sterol-binding domain-containing protein [Pelomicrobium sp. G1]|uniref:SCP2 sterol-binding domain-containing protein n=1 Tax=unclassified Pelomicrobium TaxID=2815318 RepID=UPI003F76AF18
MDDFLSAHWAERYKELWNRNEALVAGLKGFNALIEYGWEDGCRPSAFIEVLDGRVVSTAFKDAPRKPDFVMKASAENWQRLRDGSLSGRAALLTKKLKFQGSMITAMKYMGPFEQSIALLGKT